MQVSPTSSFLPLLSFWHSSQHLVLEHLQLIFGVCASFKARNSYITSETFLLQKPTKGNTSVLISLVNLCILAVLLIKTFNLHVHIDDGLMKT